MTPSQNELVRTIRYEIAPAILDQSRDPIASIQTNEDGSRTLTVRHGGRIIGNPETTVEIDRHGQLVQASCRMAEFSLRNPRPFWAAAESRENLITNQIKNQLSHKFPKWDQEINQELNQKHGVVVNRTIKKTAKQIVLQDMGGQTPGALGRRLTRETLGNEQYRLTLRAAGVDATLREHQIIMWDTKGIREAHRLNPNATLLWVRNPSLAPILKHRLPPPGQMVQQAQELFCKTPEARPDPQQTWDTFCSLHPQGVAETPSMNHWLAAAIAHAAIRAGCTPDPWAMTAITQQDAGCRTAGAIIPSFFRESQKLHHAPRERQQRLVKEYRQAIWPSPNSLQGTRQMKHLAREKNDEIPPWEQIARVLEPREEKPADGPGSKSSQETAAPWRIAAFLEQAGPRKLAGLTRDAIRVDTTPGRELTLRIQSCEQPALILRMGPDNAGDSNASITLGGTSSWNNTAVIPDLWGPRNRSAWTTRGMWKQRAGNILASWVRENWGPDEPRLPRQQALAQICRETISSMGLDREREMTKELQRGLRKMFSPSTIALARKTGDQSQVTLQQYRIACLGEKHITGLIQTNPGALAWCWLRMTGPQDMEHPGQVIREARKGLAQIGVNPRHWSNTRRLGLNVMREILGLEESSMSQQQAQAAAATALNILGTGRIIPSYGQTQLLKDIMDRRNLQANSPLELGNIATLIRLFPWKPEDGDIGRDNFTHEYTRLQNLEDYCMAMCQEQTPIRSRTFQGLIRRSARWHQQILEETIRQRWENTIQAQDGRYHAWNSLIGESMENGITVTPLSDEKMLLEEAAAMNNCVYSYGEQAAQGRIRIFSIRINGKNAATAEIVRGPGGNTWNLAQVQGPWNHPAGQEIQDIAQEITAQYRKAWDEKPEHRSWMVRTNQKEEEETI